MDWQWRVDAATSGMLEDLRYLSGLATQSKPDSNVALLISAEMSAIQDKHKDWKDEIAGMADVIRKRMDQGGFLSVELQSQAATSTLPTNNEVEEKEVSAAPAPSAPVGVRTRAKSGMSKRKRDTDLEEEQASAAQAVARPRKQVKIKDPAEPPSEASSLAKPKGPTTRASRRKPLPKPAVNAPQGATVGGPPIDLTTTTSSEVAAGLSNSLPAASNDALSADPETNALGGHADTLSMPDNGTAIRGPQEKEAADSKPTTRKRREGPACAKCRQGKVKCKCTPEQFAANNRTHTEGKVVKKGAPPVGSKPRGVEKPKAKAKANTKAKAKGGA